MTNEKEFLPPSGRARKKKGRPKAEPKRQRTFYLPVALARKLRVFAAVQEQPQSEIVAAALEKYLCENANQP